MFNKIFLTSKRIFLFLFLCFFSLNLLASSAGFKTTQVDEASVYPIEVYFEYYEDIQNTKALDDILILENTEWQGTSSKQASFGFNSSAYWTRSSVLNHF